MADRPPPPRNPRGGHPGGGHPGQQPHPDRRGQYASRYRADSTGSTRGAFKVAQPPHPPPYQQQPPHPPQPGQPSHLAQHGRSHSHGHGHGHGHEGGGRIPRGHGGHRGHAGAAHGEHRGSMSDEQVHRWASQGSAEAAAAAAITDTMNAAGVGPGGLRESLMVGDGMGQMYGGGGGYGAMGGGGLGPVDPLMGAQISYGGGGGGGPPPGPAPYGGPPSPYGGYPPEPRQPTGPPQPRPNMTSPITSGKKKKKKKKKKEMTLADVASMAMADMADPQSEIGLVQSPPPPASAERKGRRGRAAGGGRGGGERGQQGQQAVPMGDVAAAAAAAASMGHQPLPPHPLSAGQVEAGAGPGPGPGQPQREGSQHGGNAFRHLGRRTEKLEGDAGVNGSPAGSGNLDITRGSLMYSGDVGGSMLGDPPGLRGSVVTRGAAAAAAASATATATAGAAGADPEGKLRAGSGGSGIIGDALLDSLTDDIQHAKNGEGNDPVVRPKAVRPNAEQQGAAGQLQPQQPPQQTKLRTGKSGGAVKSIPRPAMGVRVSSFGPGGGHMYNSAADKAQPPHGHHAHGHAHGHGHAKQPSKAQEEINMFSSMALSDEGYGATAGASPPQAEPPTPQAQNRTPPRKPAHRGGAVDKRRAALPEEMQALSPSPSYEAAERQQLVKHISMEKAGGGGGGMGASGSVASSGGFDGIEKGMGSEEDGDGGGGLCGGLWDRLCDSRFMLLLWGPPDPPVKPCPPDVDPDEYELYPEYDLGALPPLRRWITFLLFDPLNPELTSTQQFCWAVVIGVFFGLMTAWWGFIIEYCVDVVWEKVPELLLEWGWFTDLDGAFPLPHYMWVCPTVCGGLLAYITAILPKPIPDQNEWIISLHKYGVMDSDTFVNLILTATAGMASGLSLGPELPLVLSSGMVGSWLGIKLRQSILSARVLNLTAGSAAIGGFFGFPMAGALFVLELPHQMGLQYFEALSPATIASIVAVLVNRMVTGNDIKGYFNYPFLTASLPSHIFYIAILYGIVGAIIGVIYADGVKKLKMWVHDWFHHHDHDDHHEEEEEHAEIGEGDEHAGENGNSETLPLVGKAGLIVKPRPEKTAAQKCGGLFKRLTGFTIKHEPTRAAVVGTIASFLTGVICMFLPHQLFWGEAQLQTIIDNGRTPLPVFGEGDEPTAMLTAYGYCMIDPEDERAVAAGFSYQCMGMICLTKIITIGLSIGTGIIGGHFWGPLYVAAAGSRFFLDLMVMMTNRFGFGGTLSTYPCVAILCIMGSAHVVTFRAHMAIMLILTLTISAFTPEETTDGGYVGGDYSAVFPLLVVSCFVSLMTTRSHQFYAKQQCRGDIDPKPEVLCEPKKEGMPWLESHQLYGAEYDDYDSGSWDEDEEDGEYAEEDDVSSYDEVEGGGGGETDTSGAAKSGGAAAAEETTQEDIEREFMAQQQKLMGPGGAFDSYGGPEKQKSDVTPSTAQPSPSVASATAAPSSADPFGLPPSKRLDEILAAPLDAPMGRHKGKRAHRRIKSDITGGVMSTPGGGVPAGPGNRVRSSSTDRRGSLGEGSGGRGGHKRAGSVDARGVVQRGRANSREGRGTPTGMARISSYGEVAEFQPSLMDQARKRASSVNRLPQVPPGVVGGPPPRAGRHSRQNSNASGGPLRGASPVEAAGALSAEDLERGFSAALNQAGGAGGGGGGRR